MTTIHSRQNSFASSFVSTSANGLGISTSSKTSNSRNSTPNNKSNHHPLQIGPWKLGRTLGKGSTGRVLLASNVNTGQKAAVKVVSKSILQGTNNNNNNKNENSSISSSTNSNSSDEINRDSAGLSYGIEREIIIMKLLNHKNVLRLYDVWETDKALYLVLEYVEGGELFDLLVESGPLPEKTAVEFFKQIILGASYCHNLGICHRDLKPENLLLDKDLNIKIADFGMAALESNDRLLETSCGSPHYAAPEIVRGLQYHGSASDVWSCGVILFALLTGRLPFDDENIRNLLLKVQKGDYEIIDDENISIEAQSLISKMLTVDPNERIKTKDILSHPLILKYPFTKQEQQDIYNLPSPTSATKPVNSIDEIDKQILENLVILWHGKDKDSIVKSLLNNEPNPEKTFYSLLLRYRHEHNKTQGNNNHRNSLVRSSSVISKVSSSSSSGNNSSSTTPKRKSRNISASSSHKRPVSFQSIKSNNNNNETQFTTPTKSNRQSLIISNNATAPPLPKGVYDELVQHKRGIKISPENQQAMNSLSGNNTSNKRSSMLFTNDSNVIGTAPTNFNNNGSNSRNSLQLSRRLSNGSKLKRNSITSKVLSTYTKLQTFDAQKDQELKNYGKRTSADFATLCDMLFNKDNELLEDDEDEANNNGNNDNLDVPTKRKSKMVSLPSSSSFATLSRFIMEDNNKPRHASKRQSSSNYKNKRLSVNKSSNNNRQQRNSIISAKKRQSSFNDYFNSPVKSNFDISSQNSTTITTSPVKSKSKSNKRASSNPIERISRILNANDIQTISTGGINNNNNNTRSLSAFGASTESTSNPLGPPPKPISRLDPRYKAYENYQKRASLDAARVLALAQKEEEQRQKEKEKAELRRKKIEEAKIQAAKEIAAAAAAEQELARLKAEAEAEEAEAARIHAELKRKASQRAYGYDDEEDDDDENDDEDDDFEGMYEDGKLEDEETFTESSPNSVKRYSRNSRPITLADVKIPQVTRRSRHFPGNSNRLSVLSIYSSGMANSSTNLAGFLKDGSNSGSNNRESKNTRLSMLFEDEDDTVDMKFDLNQNGQLDENDNESLFFVNQKKNKQNRQSLLLAQSPALNEKNKPTLAPAVLNYKESKDTLISQNSNDNLYKAFKLPEIPGSPIKDDTNRKRASQQQQQQQQQQRFSSSKYDEPVDIFNDNNTVVADLENNAGVPSRPAPAAPPVENIRASKINGKFEFKEASTTNNNVASPVVKERKPLGEIDKATQQRKDNKRKNSFFRKLSFGKQQQQVEESERKTSITKAFLSLFQHDDADFETLQLDTVLSQQDVFDALNSLFVSWKQHGINKLQVQKELHKMTASISKENALGLKQCKIGVSVASVQKSVKGAKKSPKSRLVFSNLKGSSKSFKKLVGEIRSILDNENVLVVA